MINKRYILKKSVCYALLMSIAPLGLASPSLLNQYMDGSTATAHHENAGFVTPDRDIAVGFSSPVLQTNRLTHKQYTALADNSRYQKATLLDGLGLGFLDSENNTRLQIQPLQDIEGYQLTTQGADWPVLRFSPCHPLQRKTLSQGFFVINALNADWLVILPQGTHLQPAREKLAYSTYSVQYALQLPIATGAVYMVKLPGKSSQTAITQMVEKIRSTPSDQLLAKTVDKTKPMLQDQQLQIQVHSSYITTPGSNQIIPFENAYVSGYSQGFQADGVEVNNQHMGLLAPNFSLGEDFNLQFNTTYQGEYIYHYFSQAGSQHQNFSIQTVLPPVTDIKGTFNLNDDSLDLQWGADADASSYAVKVCSGTSPDQYDCTEPAIVDNGQTNFHFTDESGFLKPSQQYHVLISATNAAGQGPWGDQIVTTGFPSPTITAITPTENSVSATWSNIAGASSYKVELLQGGNVVQSKTVNSDTCQFTGLSNWTHYTLSVATNSGSSTSEATTQNFKTIGKLISYDKTSFGPETITATTTSIPLVLSYTTYDPDEHSNTFTVSGLPPELSNVTVTSSTDPSTGTVTLTFTPDWSGHPIPSGDHTYTFTLNYTLTDAGQTYQQSTPVSLEVINNN